MLILKFLFFTIIGITICNGHITIDIEPNELQRMGEILVETYIQQQQQQLTHLSVTSVILSHGKKLAFGTLQLLGLLLTLVGANIATSRLEHFMMPTSSVVNNVVNNISASVDVPIFDPSEMCESDFGCSQNLCWRTCNESDDKNITQSWCYTSPTPNEPHFYQFSYSYECSPCWVCLGPCSAPPK